MWQSYKQERGCLMHFARLANYALLKDEESITFLLVTLPNIYRLKKFTDRVSNKPFLIWLLTTQLHLQYLATLPCNLSLMACFAYINFSQGTLATYARCGGIFSTHLTTSLPRNLPVKKIVKIG